MNIRTSSFVPAGTKVVPELSALVADVAIADHISSEVECEWVKIPPTDPVQELGAAISRVREEYGDRLAGIHELFGLAKQLMKKAKEKCFFVVADHLFTELGVGGETVLAMLFDGRNPPYMTYLYLEGAQSFPIKVLIKE